MLAVMTATFASWTLPVVCGACLACAASASTPAAPSASAPNSRHAPPILADFRTLNDTSTDESPQIRILRPQGVVTVEFTGELWSAPDLGGPWKPVPGAISPYPLASPGAAQGFYRAARPSGTGVFDSGGILEARLTGPFQTHFELAFAGMPDGIFPPHRDKPYFPGLARLEPTDVPVELRVRGNSSLQECPFPKLKLKVSRDDRPGTPFAEAREIDIGTHCAEGGSGTVGRLRDERAAYRVALAYEIMADLGFTSPRVRRALVEYHDTSDPADEGTGWTVRRQAVLFEDAEVVGERLGGRALDDSEIEDLPKVAFDVQVIADLRLLHALLGNWDYALSEDGTELWNTEVIALPNGTWIPMAGDFDLASWVTAKVRLNAPHDFRPDLPDLEREAFFQVDTVRQRVGDARFMAGRTRFVERRPVLEDRIRTAVIDDAGRTNVEAHLRAFYQALEGTDTRR